MTAELIDGVEIARRVRADWTARVGALAARSVTPGPAVIIVGENPASLVYVRNKVRACGEMCLVGDVDFEAVREKSSRITPVPSGVGPMTATMLLVNTIQSAELALARVRAAGALEG